MVCFPGGMNTPIQAHSFELNTKSFRTVPRGARCPTPTITNKIPIAIMIQSRQTKKQIHNNKKAVAKAAAAKEAAAEKATEAAAKKEKEEDNAK